MKSLVILGAGPKAVAVQAKAHALRSLGLPAPEITVIDHQGIGGNWRSGGGWTDGRHQLGTSPTKDVGFPYRTRIAGNTGDTDPLNRAVDRELMNVSWPSFLVATDRYASWVDRGHPSPRHYLWADYLRWAAVTTRMNLINGQVTRILLRNTRGGTLQDADGWSLAVDLADGTTTRVTADALMLTGPGRSDRRIAPLPSVLSVAGFWSAVGAGRLPAASRVAVIGGGETAASIIDEVVRHDVVDIAVISPSATIFSRGEGMFENEIYTDPRKWSTLDEDARREVISRCDRGVFSGRVQTNLMAEDRVSHLRGRVSAVTDRDGSARVHLVEKLPGGRTAERTEDVDLVIDARGNSPLWFTRMMDDRTVAAMIAACGGAVTGTAVEDRIGDDLALEGMSPTLFLPALAGFRQGPGFANLSCLGELSDRVLTGLGVRPSPTTTAVPERIHQ
ncbi:SidA/IucD/PvdA family monooxygenase [Corynebacterium terpenotabidum]|uniref:L-lysine N6-monooxygenase MbtG n=1 Tax=Corynebacterium terpenotabidum Y-11 TaxID=1200352 RepID=S4XIN3_9CORY|nr:SidA/IucD/PvdA family monooxygenase [Corynebacterium terpenotabidum]AGP31595.1 L-lysine 6-monooxygenase [Corynebacterium terpenotabidum Y-11]